MVKAAAAEKLGEEKMAALADLLAKEGNPEAFVPENIKKGSLEYLSLRYNTPMWVLKIWEHFGYGIAYRVLRKNIRPRGLTLRVRNLPGLAEQVAASADYQSTAVEGIVSYQGKTPIRKVDLVKNGSLFEEKTAIKAILDQVKVSEPGEFFLFSDLKHDQAIKELVEEYGENIGLNVGVASLDNEHADAVRFIKEKKLRNVNLFASAADGFEASISRPQDVVAVFANTREGGLGVEHSLVLHHLVQSLLEEGTDYIVEFYLVYLLGYDFVFFETYNHLTHRVYVEELAVGTQAEDSVERVSRQCLHLT
jgi:hypothetical protein